MSCWKSIGPTWTGTRGGGTPTGSVHIVDLPDPAAARVLAFDEPNYQAGVYRDVLLHQWRSALGRVDGIPDEYFQWNGTYEMTPEQRAEGEEGVKSLYDGMVRVMVKPTWAKLIDFETSLPTAIEELMQQQNERQRA
jgi:hypothetical protein